MSWLCVWLPRFFGEPARSVCLPTRKPSLSVVSSYPCWNSLEEILTDLKVTSQDAIARKIHAYYGVVNTSTGKDRCQFSFPTLHTHPLRQLAHVRPPAFRPPCSLLPTPRSQQRRGPLSVLPDAVLALTELFCSSFLTVQRDELAKCAGLTIVSAPSSTFTRTNSPIYQAMTRHREPKLGSLLPADLFPTLPVSRRRFSLHRDTN